MSIYSDDLDNRFPTYTFTEAVVGSTNRVDADNGGPVLFSASALTLDDAYINLRQIMVGGSEVLLQLTTTQRDLLTPTDGTIIFNEDNVAIEKYDGSGWIPDNAIIEGNFNFQGLTKIGGDTSIDPNGALDIIGDSGATTRIRSTRFQADANGGAGMQLGHSRGSETSLSPLLSGDKLGQLLFNGDDDNSYTGSGAVIRAYATENWGATARGTQIRFETVADTETDFNIRLIIDDDTTITLGDTAGANKLSIENSSNTEVASIDSEGNLTSNIALGTLYVSSASATSTITGITDFTNILENSTVAADQTNIDFTADDTNKRLTYTGTVTKIFHITVALSVEGSGSNYDTQYQLHKNGTANTNTRIERRIGTGSDVGAVVVIGIFSLAEDDYIELFASRSSSGTLTPDFCYMSITEI